MFAKFRTKLFFLCIGITVEQLGSAGAQQLPQSPCPQFFSYLHDGFGYVGQITLPQWPVGKAEVRVRLSQRGLSNSNYYGQVTPYPDETTVVRNVLQLKGATFRVHFADPGSPPKLTELTQNGQLLCTDEEYPPPSSWGLLTYTLSSFYIDPSGNRVTTIDGPINLGEVTFKPSTDISSSSSTNTPTYTSTNVYTPVGQGRPQIPQTQTQTPTQISTQTQSYPQRPTTSISTNTFPASPPVGAVSTGDVDAICGKEGTFLKHFVYGGTDIRPGQYPWLTAIYRKFSGDISFICGGSLISSSTIITAAHCFEEAKYSKVVAFLGRNNLQDFSDKNFKSVDEKSRILHPNYRKNMAESDLALIIIDPIKQFTQFIKPICLWSETVSLSAIESQVATVIGWGKDKDIEGIDISPIPQQVEVNIVPNEECSRSPVYENIVNDYTICTGGRGGSGPCSGDSGGALMMERNGRWTLRGIVSLGQGSQKKCNLNEYVVYCDIAKHTQWLQANIVQ